MAGSACVRGAGGGAPSSSATSTATSWPSSGPSVTPATTCAESVFASLTEPQRVGQLFMVGLSGDRLGSDDARPIVAEHFGSVTFIEQTRAGVAGVRAVANAVQALSGRATHGVRFFVAANQEGGLIQSLRGPGFSRIPSAIEQGRLSARVLEADAAAWGRQLLAAGVNLDLAPVMDVVPPGTDAQNAPIGALRREYGHDPATVSAHAVAFMKGMADAGIATTGKHFPGLGRVTGNTDFTAAGVDDVTSSNDAYLP